MSKSSFVCILHHSTRLGLALVFVLAGLAKLTDIAEFAARLANFGLVYDTLVVPAAWTVSWCELLAGLALAVNLRGSLCCLLVLIVIFLAVLVYGVKLGLDIDCGCFGPGYQVTLKTQLFIDFGLLLWAGIVIWSGKRCRTSTLAPRGALVKFPRRSRPTP